MKKKNVLFIISTPASGNHFLKELLVALRFKEIRRNPMNMWILRQKALTQAGEPCRLPSIKRKREIMDGDITNESVLEKLYRSWGYCLNPPSLLSAENAKHIFREIISEKMEAKKLAIWQYFECIHSRKDKLKTGETFAWSQEESDSLFDDIREALNDESFNIKFLCMLRNPLSIYLSLKERIGDRWNQREQQEHIEQIAAFYRRVKQVKSAKKTLNSFIFKYEDFCENPEHFLKGFLAWISPDATKDDIKKVLKIIQKPSKPTPIINVKEDLSRLKAIAKGYGYSWKDYNLLTFISLHARRYQRDFGIMWKVLCGRLPSTSLLCRHRFCLLARAFIKVASLLFPSVGRRVKSLREEHIRLCMGESAKQPAGFVL